MLILGLSLGLVLFMLDLGPAFLIGRSLILGPDHGLDGIGLNLGEDDEEIAKTCLVAT